MDFQQPGGVRRPRGVLGESRCRSQSTRTAARTQYGIGHGHRQPSVPAPRLGARGDATDLKPGHRLRTSAGTHGQITAVKRRTQNAGVHNLDCRGLPHAPCAGGRDLGPRFTTAMTSNRGTPSAPPRLPGGPGPQPRGSAPGASRSVLPAQAAGLVPRAGRPGSRPDAVRRPARARGPAPTGPGWLRLGPGSPALRPRSSPGPVPPGLAPRGILYSACLAARTTLASSP
jgi:hypothetical protein